MGLPLATGALCGIRERGRSLDVEDTWLCRERHQTSRNQRSVISLELKSMGPTCFGLRLKPESDLDVWPGAPMVVQRLTRFPSPCMWARTVGLMGLDRREEGGGVGEVPPACGDQPFGC